MFVEPLDLLVCQFFVGWPRRNDILCMESNQPKNTFLALSTLPTYIHAPAHADCSPCPPALLPLLTRKRLLVDRVFRFDEMVIAAVVIQAEVVHCWSNTSF